MRRAVFFSMVLAVLIWAVSALAQQALKGKIVTEDGATIEVMAYKNLLGQYKCTYKGMQRMIPVKDIAAIESGGTKFEMGSMFTSSPTAAYKATLVMRGGEKLDVEVPRGMDPICNLNGDSMDSIALMVNDPLSGGARNTRVKCDQIAKMIFD